MNWFQFSPVRFQGNLLGATGTMSEDFSETGECSCRGSNRGPLALEANTFTTVYSDYYKHPFSLFEYIHMFSSDDREIILRISHH